MAELAIMKQMAFNIEHGITPIGITKASTDIMEGAYAAAQHKQKGRKVVETAAEYEVLSPELAMKKIKQLEEQMYKHARDLEFEDAARIRDQIHELQTQGLGLPKTRVG
ncbi:MAG: UvrB/UvrC motif-containing protein [Gammaproteobacteria bacterium]